jgi:beta-glucosidase
MARRAQRLPAVPAAVTLAVTAGLALARGAQAPSVDLPFRNPDLPLERRIDDLIGRLTLEEKVSLMIERAAPVERLGIPRFPWWNEALHGVARAGRATVFPQAIGLAATWDTDLMFRVANAISDEARAMHNRSARLGRRNLYQGLVFWSPNINIFRDPRWGRGQETYGEDPFLTGAMGTAFVRGMQGDDPRYLKVVATPKHYAVHSGPEPLRHTFDARPSEVDLRETYLPAFRATVVEGRAESVMCSYNSVRGKPACGNDELLGTILRGQWGFEGYVVSDCGAVQDISEGHHVRGTSAEAAAMALLAGTDLECGSGSSAPGSPDAFLTLGDAVQAGLVKEGDLDRALRRLIRAQMRLGVYDPEERVPYTRLEYETVVDSPRHRELALEAARKAIVLLKNEGATLPLRRGLGTIAVIGPNAAETEVLLGNYNGTPAAPVSVLAGLKAKVGAATKVLHARGAPLAQGLPDLQVVPGSALFTTSDGRRVSGLKGDYYRGHFEGGPVLTRVDAAVDFNWGDVAPVAGLGDDFSVRWTGEIQATATGRYTLGFRAANAFRLLVDGKPVASGRSDHEPLTRSGSVTLRAGRSYPIRIELEHEKYDAVGHLLWEAPGGRGDEAAEAVAAAKAADAVVLVLGLSSQLEGEEMPIRIEGFQGGDRTSLDLPKVQQALLESVAAAAGGKPVVLVLLNGSALGVGWADANVPAIVEAWYPGQAGGTAVADVLFGDANPAGRLPVTFYLSVDQLPPFEDYDMKGRSYRYFTGEALYPFGHGLSFTRFAYAGLRVPKKAPVGAPVEVAVEVRNVGPLAGDEVVQLYVTARGASEPAPLRALKGFRRLTLRPGERRLVKLTLSERDFSLIAADGQRVVEPGVFRIAVGGRQPDIGRGVGASTTAVVFADLELTGTTRRLAP